MADEHRHTDNAVCPYCGTVERDSWEYNFGPGLEGDGEVTCGSCGEKFFCSRHVSVTYSTKPIAGVGGTDGR